MVSFKMCMVCQFCAHVFCCTLSHRFSHLHLPRRRSHFTTKRIRSCYIKRRHIPQSPSVEYPPRAFPHSLHGLRHRSAPNASHLFMRPIFSYILSCVLLLSSAYFASPFLPGNYLMFFRTEFFSENGLSIFLGFCTAFFMIVLSCVIGCLRIEQMDILEKE